MNLFELFVVVATFMFRAALCQETFDPSLLPRPLIIEFTDTVEQHLNLHHHHDNIAVSKDVVRLECDSWRFGVEANNVSPWKTVPLECAGYVKDYVNGRGYGYDLDRVAKEAGRYASGVELSGDGKDAWVFDVDETLISNLPYYSDHGYGLEIFDGSQFDKWVDQGAAPAIVSSLKLYEEVLGLGFKVFLLTGRSESQRSITVKNLINAGFHDWHKLILRAPEDHGKLAIVYKSEKRNEMVAEGFRIVGNSGDQWSDILGSSTSIRSFKLPNPMYYIP